MPVALAEEAVRGMVCPFNYTSKHIKPTCLGSDCMAWKHVREINYSHSKSVLCPDCEGDGCEECLPEFSGRTWEHTQSAGYCKLIEKENP